MSKKLKFYRPKNKAGQYVGDVYISETEEGAKKLAIEHGGFKESDFEDNITLEDINKGE